MIELKSIINKTRYSNVLSRIIYGFLLINLIKPIMNIVKPIGELHNEKYTAVIEALRNGRIQYVNGKFYGKFNAKISKELLAMGAKFDKRTKTYNLARVNFTPEITGAVAESALIAMAIRQQITQFLDNFNIETIMPEFNKLLSIPMDEILEDLNEQANWSIRQGYKRKAEQEKTGLIAEIKEAMTVTPNMSEASQEQLKEELIHNLDLSVKNLTDRQVIKLREMVQKNTFYGNNKNISLVDQIQKAFNMTRSRANFIARNETELLTAKLTEIRFRENGITKYKWVTANDERVRDSHKKLNGTIQEWSNPPIVDEKTGRRANAGEDYNCYSADTEVLTDKGFKLIKDIKIGETIATLNPQTSIFEWVKCSNIVKKYVDEIIEIKNNIFSLKCSKDHTFYYYKRAYNKNWSKTIKGTEQPCFSTGIETLKKKNTFFYGAANWNGENIENIYNMPTEILCKFLAYYISDGSIDKRLNKECIHISQQNNQWMYDELKNYMNIKQGKEKLFIYNKDLFELVKPLGCCDKKYIPSFVKNLNVKYLRIFLNAYALCDGQKGKVITGFNGKRALRTYNQYFTTSKQLIADLVELIIKTGFNASVYKQNTKGKQQEFRNGIYTINHDVYVIQEKKTVYYDFSSMTTTEQKYNNFVYDIEVEKNHTLLIKTGKDIHWNSNCRCQAIGILE